MALSTITARDGNGNAVSTAAMADLAGNLSPSITLDNARQTYRASASFTPFATAALALVTIIGSASKTVRVSRILIGGAATALADTLFRLTRVSVIGTGGTAVAPTVSKHDTNSAAATAVVQHYTTAAQSTGTVVSALSHWRQFIATVTTPATAYTNPTYQVFPEAGFSGQQLVLRGTSDMLQLENLNAGNLGAATVLEYVVEWTEDAS
jgi:hypothetical protein